MREFLWQPAILRKAIIVKKINLSLATILIYSITFPIWATEDAPPRVYGQPVATVPEAVQPVVAAPVTMEQPVASVPSSPSESPLQPIASNKSRLTFMDSKLFDVRLGKELESGKDTIEVDVSGRVPLSNIPVRIDRWVVKSAEEGKVELLPSEQAPKTRFIFSLIPMIFNAVGFMKDVQEEKMFDRAKNYDTKIYYKKDESGETLIEKIVMTKRKTK